MNIRHDNEERLHPELAPHVSSSNQFAGIEVLHHPLIVMVPFDPRTTALVNQAFVRKKQAIADALRQHQWETYVFLHERPYRFDALKTIQQHYRVDPAAFWRIVRNVWLDSDCIRDNHEGWLQIWSSQIPERDNVMDHRDFITFQALPPLVQMWRGGTTNTVDRGLSWTLKKDLAISYARKLAKRHDKRPYLADGHVLKSDILAYFGSRGHAEVIILPTNVINPLVTAI